MNDTIFKRKCPECQKDLEYRSEKTFKIATRDNTKCYKCANLGENNPNKGNHKKRISKVNLIGEIYGKLTVLEKSEKIGSWVCQCSCENKTQKNVETYALLRGLTKSCGCLVSLPSGEAAFNHLLRAYKNSAKDREIDFKLTSEEFKGITQKNCYYCDCPPSQEVLKGSQSFNGQYLHNGIDRIDSGKAYEIGNVRPCCKICNYAKHIMSEKFFVSWIYKVAKNLKKYEDSH